MSVVAFTGEHAIALTRNRKIPLKALRRTGLGYNVNTRSYVVPVYYANETGKLWDLRCCKLSEGELGKLITTSGCSLGLLGWEYLEKARLVWLCEGEWDAIALQDVLISTQRFGEEIALGVPGSGVFKKDWAGILRGKSVNVVYDHDDAGREGGFRVYSLLKQEVEDLQFAQWPKDTPVRYDVRDLYCSQRNRPQAVYRALENILQKTPPGTRADVVAKVGVAKLHKQVLTGEAVPAKKVYEGYRKWLRIPDSTLPLIDVTFGVAIANRIKGEPLWLFLIGEPGSLKTEMLVSLLKAPFVEYTDTLTPAGLISGITLAGGVDPSLLAKFNDRGPRVLIIEEFTAILGLPDMVRQEVFSILRTAYSGKAKRTTGVGAKEFKNLHFGILAGVTPIIEQHLERNTVLGERFIGYRIPVMKGILAQRELIQKAQSNVGKEIEMRSELSAIATEVLSYSFDKIPTIPEGLERKIIPLAQATALMRGTVTRDRYTREVKYLPYTELATRLVKQFTKALLGVTMFHHQGEATTERYRTICALAAGSMPTTTKIIISAMYREPGRKWSTPEMAEVVGLADATVDRLLQNLSMLQVVTRIRQRVRMQSLSSWKLDPEILEALEESELFN